MRKEPSRISALVPDILKQAAAHRGALEQVRRAWPRWVGKALAAHTKPVSLRRGRLVVQADRPGDAFALSYQRTRLLEQLRKTTAGEAEDLVIRPGTHAVSH